MPYIAPMTISSPMIIMKNAPVYFPRSSSKIMLSPEVMINSPMIIPMIAPPYGMPKHSCSTRLSGSKHESPCLSRVISILAPQLTQYFASSSFWVPHFVHVAINSAPYASLGFFDYLSVALLVFLGLFCNS